MKFLVKEYHQVTVEKHYEVDENEIIKLFGSIERFYEISSQLGDQNLPFGHEATDEEVNDFMIYLNDCTYKREDDWWSECEGATEHHYIIPGRED